MVNEDNINMEDYIIEDGDYRSFPLYSLGVLGGVRKLQMKNESLSSEVSFLKDWIQDLIKESKE